jgi:phosphate transport system permease protein
MTDPRNLAARHRAGRQRAERRFMLYGHLALTAALVILGVLLLGILLPGMEGMRQTQIAFSLAVSEEEARHPEFLRRKSAAMIKRALQAQFPETAADTEGKKSLAALIASTPSLSVARAWEKAGRPVATPFTVWVPASDGVDQLSKGRVDLLLPERMRPVSDAQIRIVRALEAEGRVRTVFNREFFRRGDSRDPVRAGFLGGITGSLLTLLVCLLAAFPVGVMAAVYLEEFAPKNRLTDAIEVNINNLAAVPSIVYGLLGLSVFLNVFGLPRSAPLVGGLTLALMTLPVIIIATRAALRAVPDSIRMAALALGATRVQAAWHHTLPLAMPGVMTGTILGLARAIGETAPLLMIGMMAFIVDVPAHILDPATVMPVQIYLWSSSAEAGFADKTAAGILVLILLMLVMNGLAIWLRKRYERRW